MLSRSEWIIVALAVVVLFGAAVATVLGVFVRFYRGARDRRLPRRRHGG